MILQTGSRTDIPAFYSNWFMNRIHEGYVLVRNPYYPKIVTRFELNPEVVDVLAFCTKNPHPMLPYLEELKDYGQFWYVSITPYGKDIEPNVPNKYQIIEDFKTISRQVGVDGMGWRYDPIFISKKYSIEYHLHAFETIAKELCGYTKICVISFIDLYSKVKKNFPEVKEVSKEDRLYLGQKMIEIAKRYGMTIYPCAEGKELEPYGANCSGCMTISMFENAIHCSLDAPKMKTREECACFLGNDIGAYNTCFHFCRYCYANYSQELVKENYRKHDPDSPMLIGNIEEGDEIRISKQKSWKELTLF